MGRVVSTEADQVMYVFETYRDDSGKEPYSVYFETRLATLTPLPDWVDPWEDDDLYRWAATRELYSSTRRVKEDEHSSIFVNRPGRKAALVVYRENPPDWYKLTEDFL